MMLYTLKNQFEYSFFVNKTQQSDLIENYSMLVKLAQSGL